MVDCRDCRDVLCGLHCTAFRSQGRIAGRCHETARVVDFRGRRNAMVCIVLLVYGAVAGRRHGEGLWTRELYLI